MHKLLSLLGITAIALVLLPSCNVVKMQARQADKALRKAGLVEHTYQGPNGPLHVWASAPTGKPKLMLVHGITGSARMWSGNAAVFSAQYDLILPDLIGHGGSTDTWSGNSVDAQVAHMALILDSLKVQEAVHVVGNSYGGAMSANFAEQRPDRTRSLVIYDGPANTYTRAVADSAAKALGAPGGIMGFFTPATPEENLRNINGILYTPRKVPRFALKQMWQAGQARQSMYHALLMDLIDREAEYAEKRYMWTMPVHVLWGEGDRLIPPSVGRGIIQVNGLPADRLVMIPQAGHVANIERPREFEAALLPMLKDGACPLPDPVGDGACTMEYDPWCGCDGRTYSNRCAAWRAGVRAVAKGECPGR
ncbi:MAG TPA: alpha/beta fold hydrolase [Flavobacteriales bacterium]